ncbi:hypothetical protein ZIOFF_073572 [Zingiber officinale]|uniref:poly(A)-specific ribonuclease n=1 Tax=Zingiber officinale TaxID=94328 RepID=A0A8J5C667_ZINOF|nr:hypothetical protein ZIOFF_073572 [Zingiber officinale]
MTTAKARPTLPPLHAIFVVLSTKKLSHLHDLITQDTDLISRLLSPYCCRNLLASTILASVVAIVSLNRALLFLLTASPADYQIRLSATVARALASPASDHQCVHKDNIVLVVVVITIVISVDTAYPLSKAIAPIATPATTPISFNVSTHAPLKLTSSNYLSWCPQCTTLLTGHDLLGFIEDQLILNVIIGSLSPTLISFIAAAHTSCDTWNTLALTYGTHPCGCITKLKTQLRNPVKGSQSIIELMKFIKSKFDELALKNAPLDIEDLTIKILHGLDDDYKELACAIQLRDAISYEELHEKLLNHEAHFAACKDTQITFLATTHPVSQSVASSRRQPYPPVAAHPPHSACPIGPCGGSSAGFFPEALRTNPTKSPPTEPLLVEPLPSEPAATIAPPAPTPPVQPAPSTNSHPMVTRSKNNVFKPHPRFGGLNLLEFSKNPFEFATSAKWLLEFVRLIIMAVAVVNNVNDMLISSSAASTSRVEVRSVWAHNLDEEFALIRSAVPFHPFVALDTEYPGVVVASKNPYCTLTLPQRYELIRANVEALRIVQVGLTLSDAAGNLPCAIYSDGTCVRYVWEFNFRDFDISRDRYAPSSVELLKANGIDFQKNQIWGIDSCRFAQHLATSGLLSFGHFSPVSWVTFQGAYDFAFLVKMLTCDCKLPKTVREFLHLVHFFFGKRVFDVKHLSKHCLLFKSLGEIEPCGPSIEDTDLISRLLPPYYCRNLLASTILASIVAIVSLNRALLFLLTASPAGYQIQLSAAVARALASPASDLQCVHRDDIVLVVITIVISVDTAYPLSKAIAPIATPATTPISFNVATHAPLKQTSSNYLSWCPQCTTLLTGHDLLGFIEGSHPCSD